MKRIREWPKEFRGKWKRSRSGFTVVTLLALIACVAMGCSVFGSRVNKLREERIRNSPNFDGEKFRNLVETKRSWSFSQYVRMFNRYAFGSEERTPSDEIDVALLDSASFGQDISNDVNIYWLGHATALIEIDGFRILVDPVWSDKVFPLTLMNGPPRFHANPLALDELPRIDAVLISHDHADHLDKPTALKLAESGVNFYTPLGVGAHLEKWGVNLSQINELDWWGSAALNNGELTLTATPARHMSGRGLSKGSNKTLWASWVITGKHHRVFFSGDTGFFTQLEEIGVRYGPFDFTLMAIGAYDPDWPDIHLTPEQAVEAHILLRGAKLIPIHWGTFNLAFHSWFEPPERLVVEAQKKKIDIFIPRPGQMISKTSEPTNDYWWREYVSAN